MLKSLKRMSVNFKVNAVLLLAFTTILLVTVEINSTSFTAFINRASEDQLVLEASILQQHFADVENEVLNAAKLLSSAPRLVEAIEAGDTNAVRMAILLQGESLALDNIDVVSSAGERLLAISAPDVDIANAAEDRLLELGLIGVDTTDLIANEGSGAKFMLVGVADVKNATGEVIGAVLAGRTIDESFMEKLNFARSNTHIVIIYASEVVAQSHSVNHAVFDIEQDQTLIDQALRGQMWISENLIIDEDNQPYSLAYSPLSIGGQIRAVLGLKSHFESLHTFQSDLTTRNMVAIGALSLVALLGIALLVWLGVTRSLNKLKTISKEIAGGDFQQRASVGTQDEIGQLALAFNEMSEAIQKRENNLREQAEELRVAMAKAKEAARVKGEFLASVSHELRTPLNAIIGFSDMLLAGMSGSLNEKQEHKIARLRENGARLLALINDLLDLTRIESGRLETVEKPYSPRALVERVTAQMESLAVKSNLQFQSTIGPDIPEILIGDEKRVEQVVVNLVSNAIKFTPKGSVALSLESDPSQENWKIIVADTGIGIPPHARDLIFEQFRQVDGSYTRMYKGSGLGLAITRDLVRMMNGQIGVESELDVGSTFTVRLPLEIPEEDQVPELEGAVHV